MSPEIGMHSDLRIADKISDISIRARNSPRSARNWREGANTLTGQSYRVALNRLISAESCQF